ncbi:MAG: hypothetical protein AABZ06_05980, partial [Bdellovibrionota bacterium]
INRMPLNHEFQLILGQGHHLRLPLAALLFDLKDEKFDGSVLFQSMFVDEDKRYRLIIEKLPK